MKILQLRFKNLNSLAGEWEIDFTAAAFAADGIFAITGATGAGKTTILDAICLALYGRTPRLARINKSGNEIMTRQCGECFAEVTFASESGTYRCHWSQRRARKKADGELQPPRHEIAAADTGAVLETHLRRVGSRVEELTGMDFARFTRSMLLAQGDFAAFLQADADERAPILEQITGTDIYSQISMQVHQRRGDERHRLETLQQELDALHLPDAEQLQQMKEELAQLQHQQSQVERQLFDAEQALQWREGISRLEQELLSARQRHEQLQQRLQQFSARRQRLQRANAALELDAPYAALAAQRRQQQSDEAALEQVRAAIPAAENAVASAGVALDDAVEAVAAARREQQRQLPLLRQVRELDLEIAALTPHLETAAATVAATQKDITVIEGKNAVDNNKLSIKAKELDEVCASLHHHAVDAALVEQLTGLENLCAQVSASERELDDLNSARNQAQLDLEQRSTAWQQCQRHWQQAISRRDEVQKQLQLKQQCLEDVLSARDLAGWRHQQQLLREQEQLLTRALENSAQMVRSDLQLDELTSCRDKLQQRRGILEQRLAQQLEQQRHLEQECHHQEEKLQLEVKIVALEEERSRLRDGEACPLCGALEHPYAHGIAAQPDDTRQRLQAVRAELEQVRGAVTLAQTELAGVSGELEQIAQRRREWAQRRAEAHTAITDICSRLQVVVSDDTDAATLQSQLERRLEVCRHELDGAAAVVAQAEQLVARLEELRRELDEACATAAQLERNLGEASRCRELAQQQVKQLQREADGCCRRRDDLLAHLAEAVEPFGMAAPVVATLDSVLEQLRERRRRWQHLQQRQNTLAQEVEGLKQAIARRSEGLEQLRAALETAQQHQQELLHRQQQLQDKRRHLFGSAAPDEEEQRLAAALAAAADKREQAQTRLAAAQAEQTRLAERVVELTQALQGRAQQLTTLEQEFSRRLAAADFVDEEQYRAAVLPEDERRHLAEQARQIDDEFIALQARLREKEELLAQQRQRALSEKSVEDLQQAAAQVRREQHDLLQRIGALSKELHDIDTMRRNQQQRLRAVADQQRECARWEQLHELVGSADGKKFRNFAQGITFEVMVSHANRQLRRMSDRYLLVRDAVRPLELNVIDSYQAGEIRSTKNLSGGESFIVSLALALGLSCMASRNVRVDSLFLDEGFGTLDEEVLETALETLAGLRQDGKLIGVISHVAALKERISTRISVNSSPGGISTITGPGCRRIN